MSEKLSEATGGVNGYAEVREQLRGALELLERAAPETLFTLGGDCSVELAPISYLNRRYPDLGVVWFDAHADLQVPATSPSGDLHGMPLRLLLGEGEESLKAVLPSSLRPEQVLLAGVRALDPEEKEVIVRLGLTWLTANEIGAKPDLVAETVRQSGWKHLYLHVDLDVLEPSAFASLGWPEPSGLRPEPLRTSLQSLHATCNIVGGGLTEYLPVADSQQAQRDEVAALEILDVWSGLGRLNEQR